MRAHSITVLHAVPLLCTVDYVKSENTSNRELERGFGQESSNTSAPQSLSGGLLFKAAISTGPSRMQNTTRSAVLHCFWSRVGFSGEAVKDTPVK